MTPEQRHDYWQKLLILASQKNLEFFTLYAEYLREEGIVSNYRKALHDMCLEVLPQQDFK